MKRSEFQPHTLAEPYHEADVPWLLYPLFARGTLSMLIGEAKTAGKSTFVLNVISQMLRQIRFMGRTATKADVLYITEQAPVSFQRTLRDSGMYRVDDRPQFHFIYQHEVQDLSWDQLVRSIDQYVEEQAVQYVVIDTMGAFLPLAGEGEGADTLRQNVLHLRNRIAVQHNIGVLMTHHTRKIGQNEDPETVSIPSLAKGYQDPIEQSDTIIRLYRAAGKNIPTNHRRLQINGRMGDYPSEPLQLLFEDQEYHDIYTDRMLTFAEQLWNALPDQFDAALFNVMADALKIERTIAWDGLRYWQHEQMVDTLTAGKYRKQLE